MRMDRLVKKAFTLVEVLVVITIITILAGLILGGIGGATTQSLKANTKSTLMTLTVALERYKKDNGDYPTTTTTTASNLMSTIFGKAPDTVTDVTTSALLKYESFQVNDAGGVVDNWDNGILYIPYGIYSTATSPSAIQINASLMPGVYYNPSSFQLISAGPDGSLGTSDDIYNFEKK